MDKELLGKLERDGFVGISQYYSRLMNPANTPHAIAGQALLESYGVSIDISSIIGAHHGTPVDDKKKICSQLSSYANNYFQVQDKNDPVHRKWKETQISIFNWALEINEFESAKDLPTITQPGQSICWI